MTGVKSCPAGFKFDKSLQQCKGNIDNIYYRLLTIAKLIREYNDEFSAENPPYSSCLFVNQTWTSARRLFTAAWQMSSNVETPRVLTSATWNAGKDSRTVSAWVSASVSFHSWSRWFSVNLCYDAHNNSRAIAFQQNKLLLSKFLFIPNLNFRSSY